MRTGGTTVLYYLTSYLTSCSSLIPAWLWSSGTGRRVAALPSWLCPQPRCRQLLGGHPPPCSNDSSIRPTISSLPTKDPFEHCCTGEINLRKAYFTMGPLSHWGNEEKRTQHPHLQTPEKQKPNPFRQIFVLQSSMFCPKIIIKRTRKALTVVAHVI